MKKSTLIMILSLVLAVAIGVGSTMAYLQDTDEDVNVMTLGNVDIEQIELERDENGELQQFTQGKPLYPAVYDGYAWDPENVKWPDVSETADSKVFDDETMSNVIDKFVFVKNTGKSDAYVRTIMAFELGSYDIEKVLASDTPLIHLNANDKNTSETGKGHWDFKWLDEIVTIDGNNYALVEAVYLHKSSVQGTPEEGILPAGATSYPSLLQLFLDKSAKNEDIEAIDGNKNGTYDILVVSQAVQTMGFADAQTALDEAFGPITADNNPWKKGGEDLDDTPVFPVNASGADEMMAGLAEGADIIADKNLDGELIYESNAAIELDAKGATVQLNGAAYDGNTKAYSYFGLVPPAGEDVTLSNLNVTGTGFVEIGHYGQGGGDYTITNLKIVNLASTLATGNNGNVLGSAFCQYGNAVLKDCVMTGTTAADPAATPYDACFINSTNTLVDGGKYGKVYVFEHGKVTFTGAEIDVIDSYARGTSGELVIGNGAKVNTVNIKRTDDNVALTIESGATVGTINYNGTAYTQAEWLAR